jgi:cytochrome P450
MLEANRSEPDTAGLVDNLSTFLGAGTETTAVALCWAWYLLATHPAAHRKLRQEVDSVLGSNRPTFDDLPRLGYTRMVVDEVLRLYPPAWVIGRTAIADDQISGFHIPGGSTLVMSPWLTHRNAIYWENPESFDPERFTPQRSSDRPQYAYYPFGGGPRMSAPLLKNDRQYTLALAMTAQRFEVQVLHDGEPRPGFHAAAEGRNVRPIGLRLESLKSVDFVS